MDRARFTLALPGEAALLDRLVTALAVQEDPPITVGRSATAVLRSSATRGTGCCVVVSSRRSRWRSARTGNRSPAPSTRRPRAGASAGRAKAAYGCTMLRTAPAGRRGLSYFPDSKPGCCVVCTPRLAAGPLQFRARVRLRRPVQISLARTGRLRADARGSSYPAWTGNEVGDEEDHGGDVEADREHDGWSVARFHEAEEPCALAHLQPGERAQRDTDAANRQEREQASVASRAEALQRRDQAQREQYRGGEVHREQRPDRWDGRVRVRGELPEVVEPHPDQRGGAEVPCDRGAAPRPRQPVGGSHWGAGAAMRASHCRSCCRRAPGRTTQRRTG